MEIAIAKTLKPFKTWVLPFSLLCRDCDGQGKAKAGAEGKVGGCEQAAAVRFNDGAANGQPHSCSMNLGGKERFEDLSCFVGGVIPHRYR